MSFQQRPRSWWVVAALGLLAALALAALLRPVGDPPAGDDVVPPRPSGSVWDELPTMPAEPTQPPPPIAAHADITDCPVVEEARVSDDVAGFVVGGGLAFPEPADWAPTREVSQALTDEQGVERRFGSTALLSTISLGEVARADGFMTPEEAAWSVFHCHLSSARFPSNNMRYDRLDSRAATVDGAEAWQVRADVRSIRGAGGTMFDIVAVDAGRDEAFGILLSIATEDHGRAEGDVRAAIEALRLAG